MAKSTDKQLIVNINDTNYVCVTARIYVWFIIIVLTCCRMLNTVNLLYGHNQHHDYIIRFLPVIFFVMQSNRRCCFLLERRKLLCKESALDCSQMLTSPFISTVYCELLNHFSKI